MDENNQYGMAMTNPLPYGCIKKKKKVLSIDELNELLKNVTLEDKVGHLFTVDIEFADINEKTLLFNEIYLPIFAKNKKISPHERSTCQIIGRAQKKNEKDDISKLQFNSKTHSTLKNKIFVNLYAEDLYFLTTRAGWKVTKIYDHYTFKQDTFKRDFVGMNLNARKTAKTSVEKDFYKLLNNSNFGNDCRNSTGNSKLELLYDGLDELKYIKKHTSILSDQQLSEFFSTDLLKEQLNNEFKEQCANLNENDPFYFSIKENLTQKYEEDLEAIDMYNRKTENNNYKNNRIIQKIEDKIKSCDDLRKNRMILEFNDAQSASIKSVAVKDETSIKCTTRFMSRKLLMFAKLSLKSFIYSLVELF